MPAFRSCCHFFLKSRSVTLGNMDTLLRSFHIRPFCIHLQSPCNTTKTLLSLCIRLFLCPLPLHLPGIQCDYLLFSGLSALPASFLQAGSDLLKAAVCLAALVEMCKQVHICFVLHSRLHSPLSIHIGERIPDSFIFKNGQYFVITIPPLAQSNCKSHLATFPHTHPRHTDLALANEPYSA